MHENTQRLRIIQFWDTTPPAEVSALLDSVRDINPDADYVCYNDDSARDEIERAYGRDTAAVYSRCLLPAMRADLFRYCHLYQFGGCYVDADFVGVGSLSTILNLSGRGTLHHHNQGITNSMLHVTAAQDALLAHLVEKSLRNIHTHQTSSNVWELTGPGILHELQKSNDADSWFEGFKVLHDDDFYSACRPVPHLAYKQSDNHWLNAWKKGLQLMRRSA